MKCFIYIVKYRFLFIKFKPFIKKRYNTAQRLSKMSIEKILTKRISFYKYLIQKQKNELWEILSNYEKYCVFLKYQKKCIR
jgi:hypothetical protein